MPRNTTKATRPSIETKALAAESKSAGMRMLFEAGYSVVQVKEVFNAPYGFVYGVAQRGGFAETAAARKTAKVVKAPKAKAAAPVKAPAKAAAKPLTKAQAKAKLVADKATSKRTIGLRTVKPPKAAAPVVAKKATASKPATVTTPVTPKIVKVASGGQPIKASAPTSAVAKVAAKLAAKKVAGRPTPERRAANRKPTAATV